MCIHWLLSFLNVLVKAFTLPTIFTLKSVFLFSEK